ncbi:MAG: hypothetical protein VXZ82_15230 [Planctomycetota bacterium]|nr:hypothetical protein [Planctomycetota bacterium]
MDENDSNDLPPVLPTADTVGAETDANANPFAPSVTDDGQTHLRVRAHLPSEFWLSLAAVLGTCVVAAVLGIFQWAIMIGFASVFGAIRVPMIQKRVSRLHPERTLPRPILMLFASTSFVLIMEIVSFLCFCAVCLPATLATAGDFWRGSSSEAMTMILSASGIIALLAFIGMYLFSLRLPI